MNEIRLSRDTEADLLEIWAYVFEQNETAADKLIDQITAQFETLRAFPGMGRSREELGQGYRSFAVGNYVIYYRQIKTGIEISRVLHGSRKAADLFWPEEAS
jgi:toxin ParE1/3/4